MAWANGDVLSHNIVNWTLSNNYARVALSFTMNKLESLDVDALKALVKENANALKQRDPEIFSSAVNTKTIELKINFWIIDFNKEAATAGEVKTAIYQFFEGKGVEIG